MLQKWYKDDPDIIIEIDEYTIHKLLFINDMRS